MPQRGSPPYPPQAAALGSGLFQCGDTFVTLLELLFPMLDSPLPVLTCSVLTSSSESPSFLLITHADYTLFYPSYFRKIIIQEDEE